ncbi:MAG: hypothetical protein JXQ75_24330 [Phycisphaerae bacterium]|nr:hypothetical protein [Phycisphaerae bacterium]
MDWGQTGSTLAFASAWRLGNLNEDEQETVAREAIANQMGKEEVRQVIQLRKRSKRGVEKCIAEVLRMRSVVDRRHVFLGAITDEKVRRSLAKLKQNDRDGLIAASMESSYGPMLNTSGRLGIERFTIVTDQNGAARLRGPGGSDFEVVINRQLAARVVKA